MSFRVTWTESASADVEDIIRFIAGDSPLNARKLYQRVRKRAATLRTFPNRGRCVPEVVDLQITTCRELEVPPYRIIYAIHRSAVLVHAVLDSRRDLRLVLSERLLRSK